MEVEAFCRALDGSQQLVGLGRGSKFSCDGSYRALERSQRLDQLAASTVATKWSVFLQRRPLLLADRIHQQLPTNLPLRRRVLAMVLWWQCVAASNGDSVSASGAAVDAWMRRSCPRLMDCINGLIARVWDHRLVLNTASGYFRAVIRRHPSAQCWAWALEWNESYRLAGLFGGQTAASSLLSVFQI